MTRVSVKCGLNRLPLKKGTCVGGRRSSARKCRTTARQRESLGAAIRCRRARRAVLHAIPMAVDARGVQCRRRRCVLRQVSTMACKVVPVSMSRSSQMRRKRMRSMTRWQASVSLLPSSNSAWSLFFQKSEARSRRVSSRNSRKSLSSARVRSGLMSHCWRALPLPVGFLGRASSARCQCCRRRPYRGKANPKARGRRAGIAEIASFSIRRRAVRQCKACRRPCRFSTPRNR